MQRLPLVVFLLLLAPLAFAQIYTWTDTGGTVHFSEAPPTAGTHYKEITINGAAPVASAPRMPANTDSGNDAESTTPPAPTPPLPNTPENRVTVCATLAANLATLRGSGPVVIKQDGKDVVLEDSQRTAQLASAEAQYQQYCQPEGN